MGTRRNASLPFKMHAEGRAQALQGMAIAAARDVIAQDRPIIRMRAVLDDELGAFGGSAAAQIGDALFGHDHETECSLLSRWLTIGTIVLILPPLGRGGTDEHGQERGARKVGRAADAVHHVFAQHVGAVDVAAQIHLDGGVDGDGAQAADDFGIVGDLLRPQQQPVAEELPIS
jgi:hypothetical protein